MRSGAIGASTSTRGEGTIAAAEAASTAAASSATTTAVTVTRIARMLATATAHIAAATAAGDVATMLLLSLASEATILVIATIETSALVELSQRGGLELVQSLIVVQQDQRLLRQLDAQRLDARWFSAMHDHRTCGLVQRGHQLLVDDHLGDESVHTRLVQIEHGGQHVNGHRFVDKAVRTRKKKEHLAKTNPKSKELYL